MASKLTTYEFISKAIKVHGHLYDYSKVEYIDSKTKVCIIDIVYGEFWQNPAHHLNGRGNPLRGIYNNSESRRMSESDFIARAQIIHGMLYDYSKVKYINNSTKVCIIDPEFGEFWQAPSLHLQGYGNQKRARRTVGKKNTIKTDEFIERAILIHGNLYNYSKVEYVKMNKKVCIIDPIYGEFWQTPLAHLAGQGNPQRANRNRDGAKSSKAKYSPNSEQILYYVSIKTKERTLFKIGLTDNEETFCTRKRKIRSDFKSKQVEVLITFKGRIKDLILVEDSVKSHKDAQKLRLTKVEGVIQRGYSECFVEDISKFDFFKRAIENLR